MTIPRVWPNGVASMPLSSRGGPQLASADLALLDQSFQQALDKTAANTTIFGNLALGVGGIISLDSATSQIMISGAGCFAETLTGGRFVLGDNDYPQFSAPRTRIVASMLEPFANFGGLVAGGDSNDSFFPVGTPWAWYMGTNGGFFANAPLTGMTMPLTRAHDGATVTSIRVGFIVNATRTVIPVATPKLIVWRYDPFLGAKAFLGSSTGASYPTPINTTGYYNGGNFNFVVYPCTQNNVIDLTRYVYVLGLVDEDYGAGHADSGKWNDFLTVQVTSSVTQLGFQ